MKARRDDTEIQVDPGKIALAVVGVVVLLVLVIAVGGSFYSVEPDSEGVVLRFGEYKATTGPGLHGKLPFGIDRVVTVPVRKQETMEFGFRTERPGRRTQYARPTAQMHEQKLMLTGDLSMASIEWSVRYKVGNAKDYLFNVQDVEDTIRDVSFAIMNRLVGDRSVDETITAGREELADEARRETQKTLDGYACGIEIIGLDLQSATPPEPVKAAFEDVNTALQDKGKIINQALAKRNELIPAARGQKERKIEEAKGYREEKVRSATGRAEALLAQYAEYEKAPEETRLRLYIETMEEVFRRAGRKIIVDPDVKGILPLLDLGGISKGGAQ